FVQLRLCGIVMREAGGALHLADDRVERAVGVLRGAEVAKLRVRLASEAFQERSRQSRLSDARFTRKQHHLTFPGLCFRPPAQQQIEFFFPSDKFRQPARVKSLEPTLRRTLPERRPGSHRPCNALEVQCSEVLKVEQIAEKLSRVFSN